MDIIDGTGLWVVTSAGVIPPPPPPPAPVFSVAGGQIRQLWPRELVDNDDEAVLVMLALVDQWL